MLSTRHLDALMEQGDDIAAINDLDAVLGTQPKEPAAPAAPSNDLKRPASGSAEHPAKRVAADDAAVDYTAGATAGVANPYATGYQWW